MKKIFAALVGLLLATGVSFANDSAKDGSHFGFGAKVAFNYGMMYGMEEDGEVESSPSGIGFEAGLMLRIKMIPNLYFAPEFNYNLINTSHKVYKKERSYTASDLEIPLLFRGVVADKFYFTAGPQIVLTLNSSADIPAATDNSGLNIDLSKHTESTEQNFFTFGIAAGAGYNIIGGLNVDLRVYMGLMDVFAEPDEDDASAWNMIDMAGTKMMKFKVGVSYWFM